MLPRSGVAGWIAGYVIAVFVVWPLPILALAVGTHGGMATVGHLFKEGGVYPFLCVLTHSLTMILLGVLGALYIAGRRIPGWLLFMLALGPFFVGIAGTAMLHRMTLGALKVHGLSGSVLTRIFVAGVGEARSSTIIGSAMTAFALTLVALAALLRVVSVDGRAVDPGRTRPPGVAMGVAGGVAVFGLLAGLGLRIALKEIHALPGMLILLATVAAAILAAYRAPLAAIVDGPDRGDLVPTLLVLAVSMSAAALFLASAGGSLGLAQSLRVITDSSADPWQRTRILAEGVSAVGACRTVGVVDALLLFGALLVPVLLSGAAKRALAPRLSLAPWAVAILFPVAANLVYAHLFSRDAAAFARPRTFEGLAGLAPPIARGSWRSADGRPTFYVTREGTLSVDASGGYETPIAANADAIGRALEGASGRPTLVADARTTYATLVRAMKPASARTKEGYELVVLPRAEDRPAQKLPAPWAGLLGDASTAIDFQFDPPEAEPVQLVVELGSPSARVARLDGPGQPLPTGDIDVDHERRKSIFGALLRGERLTHMVFVMHDDDSLATVVRVLDSTEGLRHSPFSVTLMAPPKQATPLSEPPRDSVPVPRPETAADGKRDIRDGAVHTGNISVNGRLSAEIVQRIVRQSYGRFRLCYEKGLTEDPKLNGKVAVKFTIAADGSVSNPADGGSQLPSEAVVQCIVRSFGSLTFPQPEGGGTVTVVYPVILSRS